MKGNMAKGIMKKGKFVCFLKWFNADDNYRDD